MHDSELTQRIIGSAIEVHRLLGPGLLEAVHEEALCHEFHLPDISFKRQQRVSIRYKDVCLSSELRLDLLVDDRVIVDEKAKEALAPTDKPQLLTYLRLCGLQVGSIINFHVTVLKQGIFRVANSHTKRRPPLGDPPDFLAPPIIQ